MLLDWIRVTIKMPISVRKGNYRIIYHVVSYSCPIHGPNKILVFKLYFEMKSLSIFEYEVGFVFSCIFCLSYWTKSSYLY